MTARTASLISSLAVAGVVTACTSFYEIPIETPIQPKLDVTPFQRVLVAGFVAGGTEDVDANLETVRLLRSQLRSKSPLRVLEADVLPLQSMAEQDARAGGEPHPAADGQEIPKVPDLKQQADPKPQTDPKQQEPTAAGAAKEAKIKSEKDLEPYERVFSDVTFWKKIGEEFQQPLIITGTILFQPYSKAGVVQREREYYDEYGRRHIEPSRIYMERKGFVLMPKFFFIDGRTGTTLYSERYREEVLYNPNQNTPALSSYFELMDRLMPSFLSTLSSQKIRGTRVLLQ